MQVSAEARVSGVKTPGAVVMDTCKWSRVVLGTTGVFFTAL